MTFAQQEADGSVTHETYHAKNGVSVAANMRQALATCRLPGTGHRSALVLTDAPVLLIPDDEFAPEKAAALYAYTYGLDKSHEVLTADTGGEGAVAAFAVSRDLKLVLGDRLGQVSFMPLMVPVWQRLHRDSYNSVSRKLYAYMHDRQMELVAFRQNRIVFCNRFEASSGADAAYYMLNVWQQLGMKSHDDVLAVVGDKTAADDKFMAMATEFLHNIERPSPYQLLGTEQAARTAGLPLDMRAYYSMLPYTTHSNML